MCEWLDVKPCFCPWTGETCARAENCLKDGLEGGYCAKVQTIIDKEPTKEKVKMCRCWNTCLLSCVDDCSGSWEESQRRGCKQMPVFAKRNVPLIIPEETITGWLDRFGVE